jgi:hypothetical protein
MRFLWADSTSDSFLDSSKHQADAGATKLRAHGFKPLNQYCVHPKTDERGVQVLSDILKRPKKIR